MPNVIAGWGNKNARKISANLSLTYFDAPFVKRPQVLDPCLFPSHHCRHSARQIVCRDSLQMNNFDVMPFVAKILRDKATVAVMRLVFTAK